MCGKNYIQKRSSCWKINGYLVLVHIQKLNKGFSWKALLIKPLLSQVDKKRFDGTVQPR